MFNKIDSLWIEELDILDRLENVVPSTCCCFAVCSLSFSIIIHAVSSANMWNLEELMEAIWNRCNMLRVYTKPKGQLPDYEEPVILHAENPTIEEFCNRLHRNLLAEFAFAWVCTFISTIYG